jgi:Enoyl-CoA hydratase/isomerase
MSDGINVVKADDILEVTIDRPKANAIDLAASRRLNDVFTSFRDDPALKIAIITGAGDRFFSPGWDLKAAAAGEKSDEDWGVGGFGGLNHPRNLNKPVIAAVNGIACGGGFEVVLGTDIIVMEEHAKFALPEINVGVLPDAGTVKLRRRIPRSNSCSPAAGWTLRRLSTGVWPTTSCPRVWALPRPARLLGNWPTGRRCYSLPLNSCFAIRKWSPNTRRSNYMTRWIWSNGWSDRTI